jgi:CheY-like chemotaxis protein
MNVQETPILVVQQDAAVAAGIGEELARAGLRVAGPFSDLEHAIARAESQVVAAVLLDLDLPGCRGAGAVARFRERCPDLPVIVTAPRSLEDEARSALAEGARFYLVHDEIGRGLVAPLVRDCAGGRAGGGSGAAPGRLLHDLGNVLAAASGASELLVGRVNAHDPLAEDIRELHEAITESVRLFRKFAASSRSQGS